jgi:hypothetical protein
LEIPVVIAIGVAGGAVISALVNGIYNLISKRNEYVNDYHKMVVSKRIDAYETIEVLIVLLKTSVVDKDKRPYHFLFSKKDDWNTAYVAILGINAKAMWISDVAFHKAQELNYLMFSKNEDEIGDAIEFGKDNYTKIATMRDDLEKILADDMLDLHNVKRFLKQKTKRNPAQFVAIGNLSK